MTARPDRIAPPPAPAPGSPEALERAWFENVYAGDDMPQLTLRAVVMGALLGCVMAFSNLYVGLRAGWGLGVAITACIVSFTLFRVLHAVAPAKGGRGRGRILGLFDRPEKGEVSILENNCMQSTASSAGYSTGATLVSAFPAYLMITGHHLPFWTVVGLVLGMGLLGVFLAIPMKRNMINVEQLAFPSGTAAAETLRSLHGAGAEARDKARGLFVALGLGTAVGWFRDGKPSLIPTYLPISQLCDRLGLSRLALLTSPVGYTLTVEASTVFAAAGAIMGLRSAASMALGAVVNYGLLAPALHERGVITTLGFRGIVGWSVWSGVALMTSAALLNFFWNWRTIARAFSGLGRVFGRKGPVIDDPLARIEVPGTWFVVGVGITSALCLALMWGAFRIPVHLGIVAILVSSLMAIVACRATGETDTTPIGPVGKITQLLYGVLIPQNMTANLMTANVTSSVASSSADLLTDLKSGYLLGANPRKQFLAQFFGTFGGAVAATWGFYLLVPDASALGGDKFPAPAAQVWRAVAQLLAQGVEALPRYAGLSVILGAAVGILLTLGEKLLPRWRNWIPSPVGFGMAFTFQGYTAMAFFLGGLIAWIYQKRNRARAEVYTIPIASGFIAGESLTGVAVALLQAKGIL